MVGYRPLTGLDCCHIKGLHLRQVLTIARIDTNNQMSHVTYVVVKIESKDSWSWFLGLLGCLTMRLSACIGINK